MLAIKVDLRQAQLALGDVGRQVAFASALGLTQLAAGVQAAEVEEEAKTFDKLTPFSKRAFGKTSATKRALVATVFIKDLKSEGGYSQQDLLEPYVVGGDRFINGKKAMLAPVGAKTNQYGNLTKGTLARLKAKPGTFIGKVQTKRGLVSGVWQRTPVPKRGQRASTARLKLLIEFEDTTPVRKRLDFYGRARAYVARHAQPVMEQALAQAIAGKRK